MRTSLEPGAQKLLGQMRRKLDTASFHFRYVGEKSCVISWNEFFHLCFKFYVVVSSYCLITETFAIGFQK